eukprot:479280_1
MEKDDKSIFHNLTVLTRRYWSFLSFRISAICVVLLLTFICLYTQAESQDDTAPVELSSIGTDASDKPTKRIACLIVGDSGTLESSNKQKYANEMTNLFNMLSVYDKYFHSYCDLKIFLVNTSISTYHYNSTQIEHKLPHSKITFIPPTMLRFWQKK